MRCFILVFIALFINEFSYAQFAITNPKVPPSSSHIRIEDILTLNVVNSKSSTQKCNVILTLTNSQESYCTLANQDFVFHPGLNVVSPIDFFATTNCGMITSTYEELVPDKYLLNISLKSNLEIGIDEMNFSYPFTVNVAPINLQLPSDGTSINVTDQSQIQFCLQTSSSYYSNSSFSISIWQAPDNANKSDIVTEIPFYEFNTNESCFSLPNECPPLNKDKAVFWQVKCFANKQLVASSPVSKFALDENKLPKKGDDFRLISTQPNTGNYFFGNHLRFAFNNRFNEQKLNFKMINLSKNKTVKRLPIIELKPSLNFIDIDLLGIPGLIYGDVFKIEIVDLGGANYSIQFDFNRNK